MTAVEERLATARIGTGVATTTGTVPPAAPDEPPPVSVRAAPGGVSGFAADTSATAEGLFAEAVDPEDEQAPEPHGLGRHRAADLVPVVESELEPRPRLVAVPAPEVRREPNPAGAVTSEHDEAPEVSVEPSAPGSMETPAGVGRVVTVYSPKGGAGTTFFATNLAVALAGGGRRCVCLVDLDLQFGDVAIATSVTPSRGIVDAVDLDLKRDPTALARILTPVVDGLDSLLAPVDPAAGEAVSPELVAELLATLRGRYDYVVVDTSTHLSEITLEALDSADHQVLLTTPDLPSIKNMRLLLDTLDLLGAEPERRSVVLNRLDKRVGLQAGRATEALRHPLAAVVPADPEVGASIDAGRPLLVVRRADTMNAVLRTFAEHHLGATPEVAAAPKRRLRRGRRHTS